MVLRIVCWFATALLAVAPATFASDLMPKIPSSAQSAQSFQTPVVEHLRIKVPSEARRVWREAEERSWEPWLAQQDGFLGRDLLWDPDAEEATLLIRWATREQWKAIPEAEVNDIQERFETLARKGLDMASGNPFPLVFEGELCPQ